MFNKKFNTLKLRVKCSECNSKKFKNVGIIVTCQICHNVWDGLADWKERINYAKNMNTVTRDLIRD